MHCSDEREAHSRTFYKSPTVEEFEEAARVHEAENNKNNEGDNEEAK